MESLYKKQRMHKNREDLTGEHKLGDAGQIAMAILFITIWIADSFVLEYSTFLNHYIPYSIKIPIAIACFLLSGYLSIKGLSIVFGEAGKKSGVIRKSVFGFVRHPIYSGEILLYLGFTIISISLAAVCSMIITIVFLYYISRYEEKLLLARFGEEYRCYKDEIPMWIPRLRLKKDQHLAQVK